MAAETCGRDGGKGGTSSLIGWASLVAASAAAQDIERDPIRYSAATPRNVVSELQERLAKGTAKLEYEPERATCGRCSARSSARVVAGAGLLQDEPPARADLAQDAPRDLLQR